MTRIRVNTEDLKAKAKDFESAADAFARAGDDIAAAAAAMPSYDGQLSGPARKAGAEIQSQARDMRTALTNDTHSLRSAAQGFEAVENETTTALDSYKSSLSDAYPDEDKVDKYKYTWWDDVNKEWVTTETTIVRHHDGDIDTSTKETRESTVTNPDGSVTHKKTVREEKVITQEDVDKWNRDQQVQGIIVSGLIGLLFFPVGLLAGAGFWASFGVFVASTGTSSIYSLATIGTPPFEVGETVVTTTVESETTWPDGGKTEKQSITTETYHKGSLESKVSGESVKVTTREGNSVETDTATTEEYYPKDQGGGLESKDEIKVETRKENGVNTVTSDHSKTTYNPDGSVKDTQVDDTRTYQTLE